MRDTDEAELSKRVLNKAVTKAKGNAVLPYEKPQAEVDQVALQIALNDKKHSMLKLQKK